VLLRAVSCGTNEIIWHSGKPKRALWRWQKSFKLAGVDNMLCDWTGAVGYSVFAALRCF